MGQIARQAAEELLQSSRTDLAPLEALEKTRGDFRRRVEGNLNRLPGFDPAAEVKYRRLEEIARQLVEAWGELEAERPPPDIELGSLSSTDDPKSFEGAIAKLEEAFSSLAERRPGEDAQAEGEKRTER